MPDPFIAGMEDMRPVGVHHDAGLGVPLGMAVAGKMWPEVEYIHLESRQRQFACNHGAGEARTHHSDPLHDQCPLGFRQIRPPSPRLWLRAIHNTDFNAYRLDSGAFRGRRHK